MKLILLVFTLCLYSSLMAQPANDNPCTATSLPVGASCTYVNSTTVAATNTAGVPAPGCASYSGPDVWFSFVVPASGSVQINSSPGTTTDSGMALYTGSCGSLTLVSCDDDSSPNGAMSLINANGLTVGSTVYVRMWDYGGGTGTFSICVTQAMPCGVSGPTANTNDFCPTPATLTAGSGSFSASTDVTFSSDQPGNVSSVFCGSIENNSWYQFTASATTASFPITSVTGCVNGYGIQAHVFSITYTGGCCTGFTSVSNCYNPGNTTLGTVTATGLTVGQQYMLMIDGNAGDGCEFTISGWTGINILPVELVDFRGVEDVQGNALSWKTLSEINCDKFIVKYSYNGKDFVEIGEVEGAGSTTKSNYYSFLHETAPKGLSYYQLEQVDADGRYFPSEVITINRLGLNTQIATIYPNPSKDMATLEYTADKDADLDLLVMDQSGKIVYTARIELHKGVNQIDLPCDNWKVGVYSLNMTTVDGVLQKKFTKI